jgi:hypothetical protein
MVMLAFLMVSRRWGMRQYLEEERENKDGLKKIVRNI